MPSGQQWQRSSSSGASDSSSLLHGKEHSDWQDKTSKDGRQRYELNNEDGLDARKEDLKTYEDRWIALKKGQMRNVDGKTTDKMITRPLPPHRWAFRVVWNIITIGGFLTSIYDSLVTNFKWVITLLFSSLLLSLKDYINDWWDNNPSATNIRNYHWAATTLTIIIFVIVLKCLILVDWIWETGIYKESSIHLERRLRRQRFKYLHDEQEKIDPFCRDFTMIYNDEIDPDIAMCVYRAATDYMPSFLWFVQPDVLVINENRRVLDVRPGYD